MKYSFLALLLGLLAFCSPVSAQSGMINSFETPADLSSLTLSANNVGPVTTSVTQSHVTDGHQALQINFLGGQWPSVKMTPASPWNWNGCGGLALDVTNISAAPALFAVRIDDSLLANGSADSWTGHGTAMPGQTTTFVLPFGPPPNPVLYGMKTLPPFPGMTSLGYSTGCPLNLGNIVGYQIFIHTPSAPTSLVVDNVRVLPAILTGNTLNSIADAYGQDTLTDWSGKLHDQSEFSTRRAAEEASLAANSGPTDRDSYGGWSHGPQLAATGYFTTAQVNGKWWLVDPLGHLFFSVGMDSMDWRNDTLVTSRNALFSWLPSTTESLGKYYGSATGLHNGPVSAGTTYNFYAANLERKYGAGFTPLWQQSAFNRLRAWGFNTIGGGSAMPYTRVPYALELSSGNAHTYVSTGAGTWSPMPDPFDTRFPGDVAASLQTTLMTHRSDPLCLGYFVDNELGWAPTGPTADVNARYALAYSALALASTASPAKQAFVAQLQAKYGTIAAVNTAWKTSVASWTALGLPFTAPVSPNAAQTADMSAFILSAARKYFSVVRATLKAADPNHLYLGCRFKGGTSTPEVLQACGEQCDVVSFNLYQLQVDPVQWGFLSGLNKPCLASEFHFGATDRGMLAAGVVDAGSQAGRAADYQAYVQSVLSNPCFVGCQYFQYTDQPLTGRAFDGENYGMGFVDVTDTPYPELSSAAAAVNATIYSTRYGN